MKRAGRDGGGVKRAGADRTSTLAQTVLRLIWQEHRISRAEIARRCGLSRSTVTEIVDELLPTGLVSEVGVGPSRGGRPPIVLEFDYGAGCMLGVDMGAAHVAVALTDLRGRVLAWHHRPHPVRTDPEGTRALIAELCASLPCRQTGRTPPARGHRSRAALPRRPAGTPTASPRSCSRTGMAAAASGSWWRATRCRCSWTTTPTSVRSPNTGGAQAVASTTSRT